MTAAILSEGPDWPGLPQGVRSRRIDNGNGLKVHWLEAGEIDAPVLLLLHGFPELAYSWRKQLAPLTAAGYRVLAPDQRGYGLTEGWDGRYDGDVASCRMINLATDMVGFLGSLGIDHADAVIGHDFGSPVAAHCALLRPDIFRSVVMMSAPYGGPPSLGAGGSGPDVIGDLTRLARPRKHYQWYYSEREADRDMRHPPQGLRDFLRAYYHMKSADWAENAPFRLAAWSAEELARMPTYYIMDRDADMPETVRDHLPDMADACPWLTGAELDVYVDAYKRTGFQGALNWYRCQTDPAMSQEMRVFDKARITVPATFIAGAQDWGPQQRPGALEAMATRATRDWRGTHLIDGAGHWVQQEQPEATTRHILAFLEGLRP